MTNFHKFLLVLGATFMFSAPSFAQEISSEAKRYMFRGQAAIEEATDISGYQDAVNEFKQAIRLAPDWPAAWFNLGIAQDKAEDFSGAMESFKIYLVLAPDAPDYEDVEGFIFKLEYKQENAARKKLEAKAEIRNIVKNLPEWWVVKGTGYEMAPDNYWKLFHTGGTNFELVWQYRVKKSGDTSIYGNFTAVIKVNAEGLNLSGTQYFSGYYGDLADDFGCDGWEDISPFTGTISEDGNVIDLADGDHRAFLHCKWIDVAGFARVFERKR